MRKNNSSLCQLAISFMVVGCLAAGTVQAEMVTQLSVNDPAVNLLRSIATDGTTLFITGDDPSLAEGVFTMPIGGGSISRLYTKGEFALGITVVGSEIFWTDESSGPVTDTEIFRAPKDGGGPITTIYTGSAVGQPIVDGHDITSDGTKLYTSDRVQGRVHSLNFDGTGITPLASRYGGFFDRNQSTFIAVDGGTLYVADEGRAGFSDTPPRVQSLAVTGGDVSDLFVGSLPDFSPQGIAVGSGTLYLTNGNEILSMAAGVGTPTVFATDPTFGLLRNLMIHDNALYVVGETIDNEQAIWHVAVPEPTTAAFLSVLGLGALAARTSRRGNV